MKVVFEKSVGVEYIINNVFGFEFEGEGVYKFVGGSGEFYDCVKVSDSNVVEVMSVSDILDSIVDEDFSEKDVNKLKEFVYSDFDDDGEKMRYYCVYGEDQFEEFYYVK